MNLSKDDVLYIDSWSVKECSFYTPECLKSLFWSHFVLLRFWPFELRDCFTFENLIPSQRKPNNTIVVEHLCFQVCRLWYTIRMMNMITCIMMYSQRTLFNEVHDFFFVLLCFGIRSTLNWRKLRKIQAFVMLLLS